MSPAWISQLREVPTRKSNDKTAHGKIWKIPVWIFKFNLWRFARKTLLEFIFSLSFEPIHFYAPPQVLTSFDLFQFFHVP